MREYVAIRENFFGGVLYRAGQAASFPDDVEVPHHFKEVERPALQPPEDTAEPEQEVAVQQPEPEQQESPASRRKR